MDNQELKEEKHLKTWISITGYRILIILKALMDSGKTIDELVEILKNDNITSKSVSKDTVRIAINTLKTADCKIQRPSKANAYKYELIEHPFCFEINDNEYNILIGLREKLTENMHWNDIFTVNSLFEKIICLTKNSDLISKTENLKPLKTIDKTILSEISNPNLAGKKLNIRYNSPQYGDEDIEVIFKKITCENCRIYLWCFNLKYQRDSLLNVERIKKINSISINNIEFPKSFVYDVIYELQGSSFKSFEPEENEKVIDKTEDKIKISAQVNNEFLFIQRLLLFGSDFKIISPDFFKEKLINKIKLIQKGCL